MKLSVIVPVHNESDNIVMFYERIKTVLDELPKLEAWEVVFVNDASVDDSLAKILKIKGVDPRIKVITLSRRFGYHAVLAAGLSQVESDLYAMVDVDCEDPPELLSRFYDAIRDGFDVAYGVRSNREEPGVITFLRKMFYYANKWIADSEIVIWMAEFALITRQVRDAIILPNTTHPFFRAEIGYVGFKRLGVPYLRAKRLHGKSHYNLFKMARFGVLGILSSSTFLLRFVLYVAAIIGVLFPVWVYIGDFTNAEAANLAIIFSFYFLLIALPVIALYLARTYKNGVGRPLFVIDHKQTFL